jgi:RNA polymerase sigma-70 factor (ECF subfamily)
VADGSHAPYLSSRLETAEIAAAGAPPGDPAPVSSVESVVPDLTDAALHDRYARRIDRIVRALVGQDSEREDLVHEALIRVFEQVGCVRDTSRLDQWVYRVTLNTVWGVIRRRRRTRSVPLEGLHPTEEPAQSLDVEARELAHRAVRIIDRLPLSDRQLLMQHWFEPGNPRQLAEGFGCAPITVKRKLKRARARFNRLVGADGALASALAPGE